MPPVDGAYFAIDRPDEYSETDAGCANKGPVSPTLTPLMVACSPSLVGVPTRAKVFKKEAVDSCVECRGNYGGVVRYAVESMGRYTRISQEKHLPHVKIVSCPPARPLILLVCAPLVIAGSYIFSRISEHTPCPPIKIR